MQGGVTGWMSVTVVDLLQVIEIDHHECDRRAMQRVHLDRAVRGTLEALAVAQPGQRVGFAFTLGLCELRAELIDAIGERRVRHLLRFAARAGNRSDGRNCLQDFLFQRAGFDAVDGALHARDLRPGGVVRVHVRLRHRVHALHAGPQGVAQVGERRFHVSLFTTPVVGERAGGPAIIAFGCV